MANSRYGADPSTSAVWAHDHLRDAVWCAQNKAEKLIGAGTPKDSAIAAGIAVMRSISTYDDIADAEVDCAIRANTFRIYINGYL